METVMETQCQNANCFIQIFKKIYQYVNKLVKFS